MPIPPAFVQSPGRILAAALVGGVVAGTIDIFNASLIYGAPFLVILRAVASGVLGKASFQGGMTASALGMGLQWLISVGAAIVYILAARQLPALLRKPLLYGPPFGAAVFCAMHWVIVPLSKANPNLPPPIPLAVDFLANMLFGLIIALTANLMLRRRV
jgi:uncharacterized membrane protein YagU involved in acid resistance